MKFNIFSDNAVKKISAFLESPWGDALMVFVVGSTIVFNLAAVAGSDSPNELRRLALWGDLTSALWFAMYMLTLKLFRKTHRLNGRILKEWGEFIENIKKAADEGIKKAEEEQKAEKDAKHKETMSQMSSKPEK